MSTSSPSLPETVEELLDTLPPVWDSIRSRLRAAGTGKFGISLEQFHVLRHIHRGCQSVAELAEKRQVSRSAVSQAVDVLVGKGLVTREEGRGDRRCVRLELTPRAASILEDNRAETRAWMEGRLSSLKPEELSALRRSMAILERSFVSGEAR
jgi:DNA-binding MarR family transcriptional regulator